MVSRKGSLITDRSERQKLSASLTSRQRRQWFARLLASQEAIEKQITDQDDLLTQAYNAGMSFDAISGALGAHSTTIRDRVLRHAEESGAK